ncbi:hypothetical protein AT6N2_C1172 [Agrobacterium tumefaciens]|nr:hypothetical protein AT6N2_C1172 [Agrobacterium tumefaciens]
MTARHECRVSRQYGKKTTEYNKPRPSALRQFPCGFDGEIGKNAITARTLETEKRFHHHPLAVDPAIHGGGLDLGIFAGDLIGESGQAKIFLQPPADIEIGQAGLDHQHIGAFLHVECRVADRLHAIGRADVIAALVTLQQAGGGDRLAIGAVIARREFRRIGHDADILVPGRIKTATNGADAAIHHLRWGDNVRTGFRLKDRRPDDLIHGLVVDDLVAAQDAVMAMAGEGVERDIGDHADIGDGFFDRKRRLIDQIVCFERVGAGLVAQLHLDIREGGDGGNAKVGRFLRCFHQLIDAHAVDAWHGRDRLKNIVARHDEHRPDEIVNGQAVFLHQTARPIRFAIAPHAAMAGDLVDQMRFVLHVRMSFDQISKAA